MRNVEATTLDSNDLTQEIWNDRSDRCILRLVHPAALTNPQNAHHELIVDRAHDATEARTQLALSALLLLLVLLVATACGAPPDVRSPQPELSLPKAENALLWAKAQSIFDTRCVVCHGCYDAPCQLKLGSYEGIDRGASPDRVYDATRLVAAAPTRLGVDAHDRAGWRAKNFHPVLPEGVRADARASLLLRMLDLKREHPLEASLDMAKEFTLELDRKQTCSDREHFDDFAKEHPRWGMPYAFPGLAESERAIIEQWVLAGAPHTEPAALPAAVLDSVAEWERFLNEDSLKGQLVGRYFFEHWFLASIRFEGAADSAATPTWFRLLRSRTKSGPIEEIPTRRPFDPPGTARVYYRFERRVDQPLEKTLMPYPLSAQRLQRFRQWFFETPYEVNTLPGYDAETSANPFRAFQALPVASRYRFLLEEAQFTLMGFIKGPVCRGQVALDVIEDRFWIYFVDPRVPWHGDEAAFLAQTKLDLDLPAESGSTALPTAWLGYGAQHSRYVDEKAEFLERETKDGKGITPAMIWDGDGKNRNAALTVFRHFDSATVEQGLIGSPPKTAWVIDYPLLERIHYLLVAGFDVYGNVMHQVSTRLYMDFLRMEGETGFLTLLPPERRKALVDHWYRGVSGQALQRVQHDLLGRSGAPAIAYHTSTPELEAFTWLEKRVPTAARSHFDLAAIGDEATRAQLMRLNAILGKAANSMPETSFVVLDAHGYFTILRDSAHTNVAQLFHEDQRRLPSEDRLTVVPGLLGAYPNALFALSSGELTEFVNAVTALDGPDAYHALRARFGLRRADPTFWSFSDRLNSAHRASSPTSHGLFDYNRLEAY